MNAGYLRVTNFSPKFVKALLPNKELQLTLTRYTCTFFPSSLKCDKFFIKVLEKMTLIIYTYILKKLQLNHFC